MLNIILARFKEPSTWAGLAVAVLSAFNVAHAEELGQYVGTILPAVVGLYEIIRAERA